MILGLLKYSIGYILTYFFKLDSEGYYMINKYSYLMTETDIKVYWCVVAFKIQC